MDEDLPHDESKLSRIVKRSYIIIISVIIIFLLLINTAPGYHVIYLLSGKLVSSTLNEDHTFELKNGGKVVFNKQTYETLRAIYYQNQRTEFKACLTGYKESNSYIVEDIYIPKIYDQTVFSVTSAICNSSTIISLHSHPPMRCLFSEQDIRSYNKFRQVNPDGIIGLMCNHDRITFFGQ